MNNDKVDEVLRSIVHLLTDRQVTPERLPPETRHPTHEQCLAHVHALALEALKMPPARFEKKMRWMAWCQGVLFVTGMQTIQEAKEANMPDAEKTLRVE